MTTTRSPLLCPHHHPHICHLHSPCHITTPPRPPWSPWHHHHLHDHHCITDSHTGMVTTSLIPPPYPPPDHQCHPTSITTVTSCMTPPPQSLLIFRSWPLPCSETHFPLWPPSCNNHHLLGQPHIASMPLTSRPSPLPSSVSHYQDHQSPYHHQCHGQQKHCCHYYHHCVIDTPLPSAITPIHNNCHD